MVKIVRPDGSTVSLDSTSSDGDGGGGGSDGTSSESSGDMTTDESQDVSDVRQDLQDDTSDDGGSDSGGSDGGASDGGSEETGTGGDSDGDLTTDESQDVSDVRQDLQDDASDDGGSDSGGDFDGADSGDDANEVRADVQDDGDVDADYSDESAEDGDAGGGEDGDGGGLGDRVRGTINRLTGGRLNAGSSDGSGSSSGSGSGGSSNGGSSGSGGVHDPFGENWGRPWADQDDAPDGQTGQGGGDGGGDINFGESDAAGVSEQQASQAIGQWIAENPDLVNTGADDPTKGPFTTDDIAVYRNESGDFVVGPSPEAQQEFAEETVGRRVDSLIDEDGRGSGLEEAIDREQERRIEEAQRTVDERVGSLVDEDGRGSGLEDAIDRELARQDEVSRQFTDEQLNYRAQEVNVQSEDREGFGFETSVGRRLDAALGNVDEEVNRQTRELRSFQLGNILDAQEFAEQGISGEDIQDAGWDVADALYKDVTGQATLYEQMAEEDDMQLKTGPGPLSAVSRGGANIPAYLRAARGSRAAAATGGSAAGGVAASGGSAGTGLATSASTAVDDVLKAAGLTAGAGVLSIADGELEPGEQNQDVSEVEVTDEDLQPAEVEPGEVNQPELSPDSASPVDVSELDVGDQSTDLTTIQASELVQPEQRERFGDEALDEVFVNDELQYIRRGDEIILIGERDPTFYEDREFPTGEDAVVGRETAVDDVAEGAEEVAEPGEQIGVDVGTEVGEGPFGGVGDDLRDDAGPDQANPPGLSDEFDIPQDTSPWYDQPTVFDEPSVPGLTTGTPTVYPPEFENPPEYPTQNPPGFGYTPPPGDPSIPPDGMPGAPDGDDDRLPDWLEDGRIDQRVWDTGVVQSLGELEGGDPFDGGDIDDAIDGALAGLDEDPFA